MLNRSGAYPWRRWKVALHRGIGGRTRSGRARGRTGVGPWRRGTALRGGTRRRQRQGRVPGRATGRVRSRILGRVVGHRRVRCATPCRPARRRSHRGLPVAIWLALDGATPFRLATSSAQRERIMGAVDKPQRWGQRTPRNAVAAIPVGALWKCGNQGTPTRARAGNAGGIGDSGAGRGTAPARGDWRGPSAVQLRGVELNPCPDASGRRQL
jgi:hypothetical protein